MEWMKGALVALGIAALAAHASAQLALSSGGERSTSLKCFYECKPGPNVAGVTTFQEITTLMLANQAQTDRRLDIYYFDGKEQCVAHSQTDLSTVDLDELNVCHTLSGSGLTPPEAGLVEILVSDPANSTPADGVYGWGKNVLGKFRTDVKEPFQGRVTGIGKYECRVVPDDLESSATVTSACAPGTPEVVTILVEGTDDRDCCNGDLNLDGVTNLLDVVILNGCLGQPALGACLVADINCDGVIDAADLAILNCQVAAGFPNPACCP